MAWVLRQHLLAAEGDLGKLAGQFLGLSRHASLLRLLELESRQAGHARRLRSIATGDAPFFGR
jgi:hypothetical protein